ncbi:hypothetical protein [Ralstonia sp. UBA689]|uniref:hypothetical protein n=1 Tax=Ralstonia sp. UBA689 TaxID=1947373 RepID=UPI0025FAD3E3|nr:hypothetical protein [Ralstonia sp. UBA689]
MLPFRKAFVVAVHEWAENSGLKVVPAVAASLLAGHCVCDGHRGAIFPIELRELRELLQQPEALDR